MQTPSLGRVVLAVGGKACANGSDTAPAVITRVWSPDEERQRWCVNVTVLPDCADPIQAPSSYLYADEESARASLSHESMTALFWPPRVGG